MQVSRTFGLLLCSYTLPRIANPTADKQSQSIPQVLTMGATSTFLFDRSRPAGSSNKDAPGCKRWDPDEKRSREGYVGNFQGPKNKKKHWNALSCETCKEVTLRGGDAM